MTFISFYGLKRLHYGIIYIKTSKGLGKSVGETRSQNKVGQNTFKNTPEDDMDTFCNIIIHITSKYRSDFRGLQKLPDFHEVRSFLSQNFHIMF